MQRHLAIEKHNADTSSDTVEIPKTETSSCREEEQNAEQLIGTIL